MPDPAAPPEPHVFYLAPTGPGVGLTSVSLGVVRALDRLGLRVRFLKPVGQPGEAGPDRSTRFARASSVAPEGSEADAPEPIPFDRAERMLIEGREGRLLEEIVERVQRAMRGAEAVVVEGLAPALERSGIERLNADVVHALDAEVILVGAVGAGSLEAFEERVERTAALYGGADDPKVLGCIVNKLNAPTRLLGSVRTDRGEPREELDAAALRERVALFSRPTFRLLGAVPWAREMVAPRTSDVAEHLGARTLNEGEIATRRVVEVSVCARAVANVTDRFRPGALIVTPGDRDDVILAACMAATNGVPLAGLLLTSGVEPDPRILELCRPALASGLPMMVVDTDSFVTAANGAAMNLEVPIDDLERAERVMDTVASHLDAEELRERTGSRHEPRLSPPAFRYRLVTRAREADRRIVLPEGEEPRTVEAAVTCTERGIARCVLLGDPDEVERVARARGLELPPSLEILRPTQRLRERYVAPLQELRRAKGVTEELAREALQDDVVLGTMMLQRDEVDGLVSGAVHTTANTVRPALQLIKTRPGAKLISSIFFMLLPERVLVYGDCAINPNPDAEELADIALQSADSAAAFGIEPRVAMISYSTLSSGSGVDVDKVREATRIARERRPDLPLDGPLQYDAASDPEVARAKAPDSPVAGRATVLIFPDLNTGNTTYKAVQRSAGVVSIGPMLQGLRRPVNDLSRGARVEDIIYTVALTAIQAREAQDREAAGSAS